MIKPSPWLYPLKVEYDRRKVCECDPRTFILDAKTSWYIAPRVGRSLTRSRP